MTISSHGVLKFSPSKGLVIPLSEYLVRHAENFAGRNL